MSSTQPRFDLDEAFDEDWYVRNYVDIAGAVASGKHASGWQHYSEHGRAEGRQPYDPRLVGLIDRANDQLYERLFYVDELLVAADAALITGWADDRADPIASLVLQPYFGPARDMLPRLVRFRRDDIAGMLNLAADAHDHGFWVALDGLPADLPPVGARLEIGFASGRATELHLDCRLVSEEDLRDRLLRVAAWQRNVPAAPEQIARLAGPVARSLNRGVLGRSAVPPPVRFGAPAAPALSIVVPLTSSVEPATRQAAFLAATPGLERAEVIYVHAGRGAAPEFEPSVQAIHELYGIPALALRCPGAPGLPRARNAGAGIARGAAVLFLSPDAIPAAPDWLDRAFAQAADAAVTGALLLDEDEAIMACGLRWQVADQRSGAWGAVPDLAGFPADFAAASAPRPADAVSGDAMLVPRALLATLQGFSEDFLLAGGEDLDFCQRARAQGAAVQVDAGFRFHLLPTDKAPHSEIDHAATMLNGFYFNELWGPLLSGGEAATASLAGPA